MTEWHFRDKVYRRWLVVMICPWEELVEDLRKQDYIYVDELERAGGMNIRLDLNNSSQTCTIIWMPQYSASVLVHEIVHLVMWTFDKCQVIISLDNEEVFAFYTEFWFTEINRVYRKYPNGRSAALAKKES